MCDADPAGGEFMCEAEPVSVRSVHEQHDQWVQETLPQREPSAAGFGKSTGVTCFPSLSKHQVPSEFGAYHFFYRHWQTQKVKHPQQRGQGSFLRTIHLFCRMLHRVITGIIHRQQFTPL